jgi:hypothetical protein
MSKYQWEPVKHPETGEIYIQKLVEMSVPDFFYLDSETSASYLCKYINKLEAQVEALRKFNKEFES